MNISFNVTYTQNLVDREFELYRELKVFVNDNQSTVLNRFTGQKATEMYHLLTGRDDNTGCDFENVMQNVSKLENLKKEVESLHLEIERLENDFKRILY